MLEGMEGARQLTRIPLCEYAFIFSLQVLTLFLRKSAIVLRVKEVFVPFEFEGVESGSETEKTILVR